MPHLKHHPIQPAGVAFASLAVVLALAALLVRLSPIPSTTLTIVLSIGAIVSSLCAWLHLHWHE